MYMTVSEIVGDQIYLEIEVRPSKTAHLFLSVNNIN